MQRPIQLAIIGECMIELSGAPFGALQQTYGGDTLNTAVYLARLSHDNIDVHYATALGTDALSDEMLRRWQKEGVQTDMVLRDSEHLPGLYMIQLSENGERSFLYWRQNAAARYVVRHPQFSTLLTKLSAMDALYLSGISLAILPEEDRIIFIRHLIDLHQQGKKLIFDGNYRPKLWQSREETRNCYRALLPHIDLALMTADDEMALWDDADSAATITRLQEAGVKTVVVKEGANGARYANGEAQARVATAKVENVVDTTAAGDSFNAAFLNAWLQGRALEQCCQQGNQLAGIVIQHRGAIIADSLTRKLS